MTLLIVLTLTAVGSMGAFTGYRVGVRIRDGRVQRRQLELFRDLADSCAREVAAGARVADAVESAAADCEGDEADAEGDTGTRLGGQLALVAAQVRLGALPTAALRDRGEVGSEGDRDGASTGNGSAELVAQDVEEFCELWELAERTGMSFAPLADSIVADLEAHSAQQEKTAAAMAGARLTEVLLLAMPVGAVGIGQSMGLDPGGILFGSVIGLGLLLVGAMLACTGVLWTEALTAKVLGGVGRRAGPTGQALVVARHLDIFALALAAGLPVAKAWGVAVGPGEGPAHDVEPLLQLGAGPAAWEPLKSHEHYGPVARQALQQTRAGTRLAEGAKAQARRIRQHSLNQVEAGAERVLIAVAAPLTLCFLPAFVLIGLVPLVIGLAGF
ncbi:type II secretion system F family protein [Corynebacterium urealyticum]|uniref:Putative membrane protein n=1 Tax=Corynebacterium urealyticum (strain ATCC 43042 / DSM 7109) TaxID=504474 RepID=B1VI15_CORU7|nr:hypothetical protein [Corynebacterium urealyticum]QQC42628.1 hypothetical protein I6H51_03375 [Corynebacterium urealyticum]CAQ05815.1 putative membrane protein [Corynebacterium urealyticum DSM 7109]SNV91486.1 type II secretion system protein F domain-containing protein [Corynebacterium urealyticum]